MAQAVEVEGHAGLCAHIRNGIEARRNFPAFRDEDVLVMPYNDDDPMRSERMGWNDVYIVTLVGYGVLGFCDGPTNVSPLKSIPVEMTTIDGETGESTKTTIRMQIAPPPKGTCGVCAMKHDARMPHNAQSLYYQYQFYGELERWPTWADAMAHCTPEMQAAWKAELTQRGHYSENPDGHTVGQPYFVQQ